MPKRAPAVCGKHAAFPEMPAEIRQLRAAHLKYATLRGAPSAISKPYSSRTAAATLSGCPTMWSILQHMQDRHVKQCAEP